jgi:hypothetical protein
VAIVGPVNWYGPTSNLKALFDRLVCMNGGNPREETIDHKDAEKAIALERSPEWKELSQNHLEGRTAAFFCYGDGGGDELGADGRPRILRHPEWFPVEEEPFADGRDAYAPLVWQCRYGGVEVPDRLWRYHEFGRGKPYGANQAEHVDEGTWGELDAWTDAFAEHVARKGKVEPGRWRAFGHARPAHRLDDLKLKWREIRIALGHAPEGSSPALQEELGLNRDRRLRPKQGEGERLRE